MGWSKDKPTNRPPGVDRLLSRARPQLDAESDHDALVVITREILADERERLADGAEPRPLDDLADLLARRVDCFSGRHGSGLVEVINATGVIVHTNLGRAAWPQAAIDAAVAAATSPVLLELDRTSGKRGKRFRVAEEHLIVLTGAEDAFVTNNNAAALALAVGLARRRGVVVSRGELIEIGGGVRIPEIVRRAGARLVEVGTTNRTRAADFEPPLDEGRASLILSVHRSNFRQEGFVEAPEMAALADIARRHEVPFVDDLGSGALLDTARFGLAHEPMPRERLAAGADLVTFSGDKLLGGPQAGLLVGRADLIARIRRDPLARAMRPDKITLAALSATLALYRAGRAVLDIPVWQAISATVDDLRTRAQSLREGLDERASIVTTEATVGGGALPGETLPSVALRIDADSAGRLQARLRREDPCVVARVEDGAVIVDLRTVTPQQDKALVGALRAAVETDRA
jgi:L-seryl-tRNA(Ser) seleniumtransferase